MFHGFETNMSEALISLPVALFRFGVNHHSAVGSAFGLVALAYFVSEQQKSPA
jgi:hypothetical protein